MNISDQANSWLTQFKIEITSSSNKVFGNGRQQLEATVSVAPRTNSTISDEQLASIALVTLDDDGVYRELNGALKASETRDPVFQYFADTGSAPSNLEIRGPARRKRFYVSSSRSGGSLDKLYARISKNADTHYVTDVGAFKSSIIVESITPLRYEVQDLELTAEDELDTANVDIDVYYLKFKNPKLQIVKSVSFNEFDDEDYHYRRCFATSQGAHPGAIGSWFTHYAFEVGARFPFSAGQSTVTLNQRPGQMNLVRTITNEPFYTSRPQNYAHRSRWALFDQYGNDRKIEVTQTDNGNRISFKRLD